MSSTDSKPSSRAETSGLARGLGAWSATAVVVSSLIGTGIFLVTAAMARAAGSADLVFAAWIIGALVAICGAFCFAELGAALPHAGGMFVYLTRGLGPIWGFLFGWTLSLLAGPAAIATIAAGFVRFLTFLFPAFAVPWFTLHTGGYEFTLTAEQPLAALVIVVLTAVNYLSIRIGGRIQMVLATLKIGAIAIIIAAGAVLGHSSAVLVVAPTEHPGAGMVAALLSALVPVMWAYDGFQNLCYLGGEVRHPAKNIPRALVVGLAIVTALYLLINLTYFRALPFARVARSQDVASDVVRTFAGASGAKWLTVAMAASALASLHLAIMSGARVPYAMACDGLFFGFVARTHPRFRTPAGALLFLGSLGAVVALTGNFEQLYSLYVFSFWIFLALTAIALIRLRRTEPGLPRPYRAWGYPWTALVFTLVGVALTVNLWINEPVRSSIGLLTILAGVPFFLFRRRQPSKAAAFSNPDVTRP